MRGMKMANEKMIDKMMALYNNRGITNNIKQELKTVKNIIDWMRVYIEDLEDYINPIQGVQLYEKVLKSIQNDLKKEKRKLERNEDGK